MPRQIEHEIEFLADVVWIQMGRNIIYTVCLHSSRWANIHKQTQNEIPLKNREENDVVEENKSTLISSRQEVIIDTSRIQRQR